MIDRLDERELRALAAIVKFIADDDGGISEQELGKIVAAAEARGLDGFRKILDQTPPLLPSNDDLDRLLGHIADDGRRKELMEMAIELAQARVDLNADDLRLLKTLALATQD